MVLEFQGRARIRVQLPVALDEFSEPQPDLAVVPHADYSHEHPSATLLGSRSPIRRSARTGRIKAALYAAQGMREYWIVNLVDDVIEVRRDPARMGTGR